jgi:hypothetical protein
MAVRLVAFAAVAITASAFALEREPAAPPVTVGVAGATNAHVSIAADGPRVVVTWGATRAGSPTDVFAAFSRDGGATFGAPVRVNDVPGDARVSGEQAPRVALADGVQVVWGTRQAKASLLRRATGRPGDTAFAPATTMHRDALAGARGWASLAAGMRGAVHVAWLDGRGDGAPPPSATDGRARPRPAMRQDLYQAVWRADGTHDETRIATDVCFCCKTAVAAGPDASVYVAWRHIYRPNLRDIAVARSTDGGRSFAGPVRVSEDKWAIDGCPDDGPSIAVDARGVVHVVWPTLVSESEGKGVFYSSSTDGGRTFAPRARVDDGSGGAAHPQIAVAGERLFVTWDQSRGDAPRDVLLRVIAGEPGARTWSARMAPPATLGQGGTYPSVAGTADGAVVAWTAETATGSDIRVQRVR